jgi:hypothetical protein
MFNIVIVHRFQTLELGTVRNVSTLPDQVVTAYIPTRKTPALCILTTQRAYRMVLTVNSINRLGSVVET